MLEGSYPLRQYTCIQSAPRDGLEPIATYRIYCKFQRFFATPDNVGPGSTLPMLPQGISQTLFPT